MTPLREQIISPHIQDELDRVSDAKYRLERVVDEIQSQCEHRIVSETDWVGSGLNAMRICNHCRKIEEGSHWSGGSTWSRSDYEKPIMGNEPERIVQNISRDEFYRMRV